jgi:PleD family two-component response regulator
MITESHPIAASPHGTILAVDDEHINLGILGELLKTDYDVYVAKSGEKALELASSIDSLDVILLDIVMPEMNGFEVCKALKTSAETRDLPVIFLSTRAQTNDLVEGFDVGAVDYLTKPFQPAELLSRVRTHIELQRIREEQKNLIAELKQALDEVKLLSGLLPICAWCKSIRDDKGYWNQLEAYLSSHSEVKFSHGICPRCVQKIGD